MTVHQENSTVTAHGIDKGIPQPGGVVDALRTLFRESKGLKWDARKSLYQKLGRNLTTAKPGQQEIRFAKSLHLCIAKRSMAATIILNDMNSILEDLVAGEECENPGHEEHRLQYLLFKDSDGNTIIHKLLDPDSYDRGTFELEKIKPILRFLLGICPDLPSGTASKPPLLYTIMNSDSLKDQLKSQIVRFLCSELGDKLSCGEASQRVIKSLTTMITTYITVNPEDRRTDDEDEEGSTEAESHEIAIPVCALHQAIEKGILIDKNTVNQLKALKAPKGSIEHQPKRKISAGDTKETQEEVSYCLHIRDHIDRTCLHLALTAPFTPEKINWARKLVDIDPNFLQMTSDWPTNEDEIRRLTPLQYFQEQIEENEGQITESNAVEKLYDDLKLRCLTHFDEQLAKTFMYRQGHECELYLGFDRDDNVTVNSLCKLSHHYKLDNILRLVEIPKVTVSWNDDEDGDDKKPQFGKKPRYWDCAGRTDLTIIFDWLKAKEKYGQNVKKVVEVAVDDLDHEDGKAHSDDAILYCLDGLHVEIWNWAKMDISSDLILQATSGHAREVYLYCSGLNSVLRSWSNCDGLVLLSKLETVHLEVHQGTESIKSMTAKVEEFKASLKRIFLLVHGRRIDVQFSHIVPGKKKPIGSRNVDVKDKERGEDGYEEQEWIKCMDGFADFIEYLHEAGEVLKLEDVKVALIDDGVKSSFENLDDNIVSGSKSFVRPASTKEPASTESQAKRGGNFRSDRRQFSYNNSTKGHGTIMAYYIRRICPRVKLYVAKLDPQQDATGRVSFSIDSVVEAIYWAIGQKVDIISMSWAIDKFKLKGDQNDPDKLKLYGEKEETLRQAISAAAGQNILLFCANPDKGNGPVIETFPKSSDSRTFCIGAATQDGHPWGKIAKEDKTSDFYLPGVELGVRIDKSHALSKKSQPGQPPEKWRKYSGSSLACALASGLAAMILHCTQIGGVAAEDSRGQHLRTFAGMQNALKNIYVSEDKWLSVHRVFGHKELKEAVKDVDKKKKLRVLVVDRLIRDRDND